VHGGAPPWLCKVFGRLPAGEREKFITDNRLCPFCLLHDKDKPCGAKQRPVSVACTTSSCKGRHIQKLHEFLKDVFQEDNRVHVVHGDGGWEESDEAWELGEEEMMIVGTIQQEDDCSWQDACNAWAGQDEEVVVGIHQVGAEREASEQAAVGQCKGADAAEGDEQPPEPEDLLVDGEEQEYFLELLMRRASPERLKESPPARNETIPAKDRKSKGKGKKARGKDLAKKAADEAAKEEGATNSASGRGRQVAPNPVLNPEAKGRGLGETDQQKKERAPGPPATSGGECSGQKKPEYS
jgi:hypothetical protein